MNAEARLYADLDALGIAYEVVEHEPVFTVAESDRLYEVMDGVHVKNLFLKDAGGRHWLVTVPAQMRVALKRLPAVIGSKAVSFGKPEAMMRLVGVTPGAVTPVGAISDSDGEMTVVLHEELVGAACVNVHPLRNDATLRLAGPDLVRALVHWRHEPLIARIPAVEPA